MSKRVIVTGATGFIGQALCAALVRENYEVIGLTRNPQKDVRLSSLPVKLVCWDGQSADGWLQEADGADALINLAGEPVAPGRWTGAKKQRILQSRLDAVKAVLEGIKKVSVRPRTLIQASGIGYYGPQQGHEPLDESAPFGSGFLAEVSKRTEDVIGKITVSGTQLVVIRIGIVLGREGGMIPKVLPPFRLLMGGHPGSGGQWLSWVHIQDVVGAILFLLEKNRIEGAFNLSAPEPLASKDFYALLGKTLNRPSWLHPPAAALRMLLGEMAQELLLSGQRVIPLRLLEAGYRFRYPDVASALQNVLL